MKRSTFLPEFFADLALDVIPVEVVHQPRGEVRRHQNARQKTEFFPQVVAHAAAQIVAQQ